VFYQQRAIAASRSTAIRADRAHYVGDLAGNLAVIAAILLSGWFGWLWADPVFALGVAALLLSSAWHVGRDSLDQLMDRELPDEERARIARIIRGHPAVTDVHDLKTRTAGLSTFIQAHIVLDGSLSLRAAHAITEGIEQALSHAYPGAQVIIHQDPAPQPDAEPIAAVPPTPSP
jgi:ferrous-iron efflux pump FieF